MSFKKKFFNNLLVSGGFNYATQALLFFSTVVTSRLLEPKTFGFVALISVFTGFVSIFSDSGISYAIIRSDYGRTYHKALDNLAWFLGLILCGFTWLFAYPVALFFHNTDLVMPTLVMGLLFVLRSLSLVRSAILSKALRFQIIGKITLLTAGMQVTLTILLAMLKMGYWSLIIPQLAAALLSLFLYEQKVKLGFQLCSAAHLKVAYRYTQKTIGNLMGFNLVNYWARNLDNLIIGRSYGAASLGLYNRAYNLLMMPMSILTGLISTVLLPSLKKHKSEGGDVGKEYLFILKIIAALTYPVSAVLILFPQPLVWLLWGKAWMEVSRFLPYFGLLLLGQSLLSTTGSLLVLFGKERVMLLSGWMNTAFTTVGIVYGAHVSILGIAQFYSLAFLALVLPVSLFYLFIGTFGFSKKSMLWFWLPIIGSSLLVWAACYYQQPALKLIGVCLLSFFVGWQCLSGMARPLQARIIRRKAQLFPVSSN